MEKTYLNTPNNPDLTFYVYCSKGSCNKYHGKLIKKSHEWADFNKAVDVPAEIKEQMTNIENYVPSLCVVCGDRLFISTILEPSVKFQMKRLGIAI